MRLVEGEIEILVEGALVGLLVLDDERAACDAQAIDGGDGAARIGQQVEKAPQAGGGRFHRHRPARVEAASVGAGPGSLVLASFVLASFVLS